MPSDDGQRLDRVRWQCRRGMLELDLLLQRYVDSYWAALDETGRDDLDRLLARPDPLLLDWLHRHSVPRDPRLRELVDIIAHGEKDSCNTTVPR